MIVQGEVVKIGSAKREGQRRTGKQRASKASCASKKRKGVIKVKTWLITGCSTGIGRGIAKAVLAKGDRAVITARNTEKLEELRAAYPDTCLPVSLEMTDRKSIRAAVEKATEKFGDIDVLVNNAGHGYRAAVEEGEDKDVAELYETNVFGPVALIKEVLPQMRKRGSGTIVNVSSIAAARSALGSGYYASSKAALELITDALIKEVGPLGIRAMIVEPGSFRTSFYDDALKGTSVKVDDYAKSGVKRREDTVNARQQPGDPDKAGQVLVEVLEEESLPHTLLLGSDAVKAVKAEYERKIREIDAYAHISGKTDF